MIYLLGDSHSSELVRNWGSQNVIWKTLLGFGLQAIVKSSPHRNMPSHVNRRMAEILASLERNSTILLSYTDPDSRIGMGNQVNAGRLFADYEKALEFLFETTEAKAIHFLDWYGIKDKICPEQSCSVAQRILNRKMQLEVLGQLSLKYPISVHTSFRNPNLETEEGFALEETMLDDCHYNFSSPRIVQELLPVYLEIANTKPQAF